MTKGNKISPCFDTTVPHHPRPIGHVEPFQNNNSNGTAVEMEGFKEMSIKASQALLAWLIFLVLSPILLTVFGLLLIWKYGVVWITVKIFKRKLIQGFSVSETIFAVDRFWENSRSSLGLVVELDGPIDVEKFRDDFRKNILEFAPTSTKSVVQSEQNEVSSSASSPEQNPSSTEAQPQTSTEKVSDFKPFAKLTQIPVTFCGYYFWQKAKYFLIHEHIRQINQPTDELGLKKAASTLMTVPFPNRRPLWEILVYPNYLGTTTVGSGTTCGSALFIRFHRSLTDSIGLMNILERMITNPVISEIQLEEIKIAEEGEAGSGEGSSLTQAPSKTLTKKNEIKASEGNNSETTKNEDVVGGGIPKLIMQKFLFLVFLPLNTFLFACDLIRSPEIMISSEENEEQLEATTTSWVTLPLSTMQKIRYSQNPSVSQCSVEISLFLEGVTGRGNHKCLNIPEKKEDGTTTTTPSDQQKKFKCQTCVLIPVPNHKPREVKVEKEQSGEYSNKPLSNSAYFLTLKCTCMGSLPVSSNKTVILSSIHNQLNKNAEDSQRNQQIVKLFLGALSLFPLRGLRYLIMSKRWGAECFIYEQFRMPEIKCDDDKEKEEQKLKLFGQQQISQIVPLVGLQWTYTLASAATLHCHDGTVIMSLISNSGILGPLSQCNPQEHAERITKGFTEELDRLSDDAEDHGFVSIPIA